MKMHRWVWVGLLALGCGGAQTTDSTTPERHAHVEDGEPCLESWAEIAGIEIPSMPEGFSHAEAPYQEGWDLAEATLGAAAAEPPEETTVAAITAWSVGPYNAWITERRTALQNAENHLNAWADGEDEGRVVAATLIGLMYYQFARQASSVPIPDEIVADEELLGIYVDALEEAVRPLLNVATHRFEYCALAGQRHESLLGWRDFCYSAIGHAVVYEQEVHDMARARQAGGPEVTHDHVAIEPGPRVAVGLPDVTGGGGLTDHSVQSYFQAHHSSLDGCYATGLLQLDEPVHGIVIMNLTIAPDGTTHDVEMRMSALNATSIDQCLVSAVDSWQFPAPIEQAVVRIALDLRVLAPHEETSDAPTPTEAEAETPETPTATE